jgi:hypothetical protein
MTTEDKISEVEHQPSLRPTRAAYAAGLLLGLLSAIGVIGWLLFVAIYGPGNESGWMIWLVWPALATAAACVRRLGCLAGVDEEC